MHSRFPVTHPFAFQHSRYQSVDANLQVENEVGNHRKTKQRAGPVWIGAHHSIARQGGVHIAIRDYHQPGLECGDDLVLEAVGQIRGVEQTKGRGVEPMARFRLVNSFLQQFGTRPAGADDAVAFDFQPRFELFDLGGATDAVGALDHDKAALTLA